MRAHFNIAIIAILVLGCDPDASPGHEAQDEGLVREGARPGCIERERTVDPAGSSLPSQQARELIATIEGHHGAELQWGDGTATRARLRIGAIRAVHVQSRRDPALPGKLGQDCADRARIYGDLELESDDGRLAESFLNVIFERDQGQAPRLSVFRKREQLTGAYIRQSSAVLGVLTQVRFELSVIPLLFYGQIVEEIGTADAGTSRSPGGSFEPKLPRGPHDGPRDAAIDGADAGITPSLDGGTNGPNTPLDAGARDSGSRPDAAADAGAATDAAAPLGCYGDEQCASRPGTKCSAAIECLPPPGCAPGLACPAVCYGYCK